MFAFKLLFYYSLSCRKHLLSVFYVPELMQIMVQGPLSPIKHLFWKAMGCIVYRQTPIYFKLQIINNLIRGFMCFPMSID
jgi:hypothetical protein